LHIPESKKIEEMCLVSPREKKKARETVPFTRGEKKGLAPVFLCSHGGEREK